MGNSRRSLSGTDAIKMHCFLWLLTDYPTSTHPCLRFLTCHHLGGNGIAASSLPVPFSTAMLLLVLTHGVSLIHNFIVQSRAMLFDSRKTSTTVNFIIVVLGVETSTHIFLNEAHKP